MLSARAEKRLDRIVEIQEEIEKLEAELEVLLVGEKFSEAELMPTRKNKEKAGKKTRKPTTCKNCGEEGHTRKTCTKAIGADKSTGQTDGQKKHRSNREPCEECGTVGSRHFRTCSKFGQRKETIPSFGEPSTQEPLPNEPITAEQYADLRTAMNDKEFQSGRYSMTNKLRPSEVNKAVMSQSYEHYLAKREE